MKILQVIPYLCFGGAEILCENLTRALRDMGHQVVVVSLYAERTPIAQRMEAAGVPIRYLDKKLGLDVSMVPKLRRLFLEEKPDVVHTHLDVIKYAALAAKLAGVPVCVHTVHSVAEKEAEGPAQKAVNGFYFRHGLSMPVALSKEIQASIVRFYGLPDERVPVIRNGIDLSKCRPKEDYRTGHPVRIVHVGRFDVPKNHPGLLRAFRLLLEKHPDCKLTLVGDGDSRREMEALAAELGINSQVEFCGMQKDVHPYLQNADIFVLPSVYEGNPMTILEAMGTGLPIAATAVGGIPDMVTDGVDALLTSCREEDIAGALARLIEDESLRARLGRAAREHSLRFSARTMAENYCRIYGENGREET